MVIPFLRMTPVRVVAAAGAATMALALGAAAPAGAAAGQPFGYQQINLVSDEAGMAKATDAHLVNPWGIAFSPGSAATPGSPLWTANEGTATSTLYSGAANANPVTVVPLVVDTPAHPTGIVFNDTTEFQLPGGAPSRFLFDTLGGEIAAWTNTPLTTTATPIVKRAGSAFTGLALLHTPAGARLLAADAAGGVVRIYDGSFKEIGTLDRSGVPEELSPYNVAVLGSHVYVTYATEDGSLPGAVDVYTTSMTSHRRLITGGALDGPWGLAVAPAHWGPFSGALLVGNEDDGKINAYDRLSGDWLGVLQDSKGEPLVNEGLWGMQFGNGTIGTHHTLIIAAGPDEYAHGLVAGIRYGRG